ncbi:MAG: hypothetical protein JXQ81_12165 [Desulfuromonadales bacterium]|nr:hypothetical protein [Desulfuromonadales bacterium]MBN2793254.1 hypothetical protein [Desulfuromonadales bacterium]
MLTLFKYFLWLVVIMALTIGFDRLMVLTPLNAPGLKETQIFYTDLRARVLKLFGARPETTKDDIENVIEQSTAAGQKVPVKTTRYLYVDDSGALQFADSLQQVPFKYRQNAQPLAE